MRRSSGIPPALPPSASTRGLSMEVGVKGIASLHASFHSSLKARNSEGKSQTIPSTSKRSRTRIVEMAGGTNRSDDGCTDRGQSIDHFHAGHGQIHAHQGFEIPANAEIETGNVAFTC